MADILINGILAPNGLFPIVRDTESKGGFRIVTTTTDRDNITTLRRTAGMWVYVHDNATTYKLEDDLTTWTVIQFGYNTIQNNGTPLTQRNTINVLPRLTAADSGSLTTLDLTSGIVSAGTYYAVTVDTYGRVTAGGTTLTSPAINGTVTTSGLTMPTFDMGTTKITGLATPTATTDAANKAYVDAAAAGVDWKAAVRVLATANITLSGIQTIDGVLLISGDRVGVVGQTTQKDNGIYISAIGAWSRSTDADTSAEVMSGMAFFVTEGTSNADTGWILTTPDPITLGTTALVFTQFTGLGEIIAGAGLTKTGNTIDVGAGTGITVATDTVLINQAFTPTWTGLHKFDAKIDATAALTLADSTATSVAVGRSGITTTITGGLTQLTGAFSLTGNATSALTTTIGNTSIDSAAAVQLGVSTATSVAVGRSGITTTITGKEIDVTQSVSTTGSPSAILLTGAAHTTLTASVEAVDVNFNLARTVQFATGSLTTQRAMLVQAPTYGFVASSTLTNAATLAISGAPVQGTNATITNAYALWVQTGKTELDGLLVIAPAATSSGVQTAITYTGQADTTRTTTAEVKDIFLNLARTVNWAQGAISLQRFMHVAGPTVTFNTSSSTITDAATLAIDPPIASTNAVFTNTWALYLTGGLRQTTGVLNLAPNATSSIVPSSGNLTLDSAAIVNLGTSNATSVSVSRTGQGTTVNGTFTVTGASTLNNTLTVSPSTVSSGVQTAVTVTGAANTNLTASAEVIDVNVNLARTVQWATGALTTQRAMLVQAPTYGFVGSSTLTTAATLAVSGAPVQGTNATITNAYAFWVQAGKSEFDGIVTIAPPVVTSGVQTALTITGAANTGLTASTEVIDTNFNLARTVQFATGTLTTQRAALFQAPTYGFVGSSTLTTAATLAISGAPVQGTNATITNAYALWVQAGKTELDGLLTVAPAAISSGVQTAITYTGQADTNRTASTEVKDIFINLARTVNWNQGNLALQRFVHIASPTITGNTSASTFTDIATLAIDPPIASTNITNSAATGNWALYCTGGIRMTTGVMNVTGNNALTMTTSSGSITIQSTASSVLLSSPTNINPSGVSVAGQRVALKVTPAGDTVQGGVENNTVLFSLNRTLTFGNGTITTQRDFWIRQPTYSTAGSTTFTSAYTVAIEGAPVAAGALTITNAYAFWVQAGASQFDGQLIQNGGRKKVTLAKTGNYTILVTDNEILADSSGGAFTLTLPSPSTVGSGWEITVVDTANSANAITIARNGSEKINFTAGSFTHTQGKVITYISNGTDWYVH